MGRKVNPKSQENDHQNQGFLQIPLLQISENAQKIKDVRVLHRERFTSKSRGGLHLRPAWVVRAAVGQMDDRGVGRGGRLDADWRSRRIKMSL
jgi:hypothetical protein